MKKFLAQLFILLPFFGLSQGIQFSKDSTLTALKERAKTEKKPIFIDCYTTWCGPCKLVARTTFKNDTVGQFYNANFICAKIDMEKGDGINIAKDFGIMAYPSFLFLNENGEELHRGIGYVNTKQFMELGKTAIDPETSILNLKKSYKEGNRDPEKVAKYLKVLSETYQECNEGIDWYFATVKDENFYTDYTFDLIYVSRLLLYHPVNQKLIKNRALFSKVVKDEKIEDYIYYLHQIDLSMAFGYDQQLKKETINESVFSEAMNRLKSSGLKNMERLELQMNLRAHQIRGEWSQYFTTCNAYVTKYCINKSEELNGYAWNYYELTDDFKQLEQALKWVDQSIKLNTNYNNLDTKAALLNKLKRRKESIKFHELAIEFAAKSGDNSAETKKRLEEIKAKK